MTKLNTIALFYLRENYINMRSTIIIRGTLQTFIYFPSNITVSDVSLKRTELFYLLRNMNCSYCILQLEAFRIADRKTMRLTQRGIFNVQINEENEL